MEYCNQTDKEFKIAIMKKFTELQANSERNSINSGIKSMSRGVLY